MKLKQKQKIWKKCQWMLYLLLGATSAYMISRFDKGYWENHEITDERYAWEYTYRDRYGQNNPATRYAAWQHLPFREARPIVYDPEYQEAWKWNVQEENEDDVANIYSELTPTEYRSAYRHFFWLWLALALGVLAVLIFVLGPVLFRAMLYRKARRNPTLVNCAQYLNSGRGRHRKEVQQWLAQCVNQASNLKYTLPPWMNDDTGRETILFTLNSSFYRIGQTGSPSIPFKYEIVNNFKDKPGFVSVRNDLRDFGSHGLQGIVKEKLNDLYEYILGEYILSFEPEIVKYDVSNIGIDNPECIRVRCTLENIDDYLWFGSDKAKRYPKAGIVMYKSQNEMCIKSRQFVRR